MVNSPQTKLRSASNKNGLSSSTSAAANSESDNRQSSASSGTTFVQVMGTFRKSLKAGSEWSEKDELLDVVYWGRQIIGAFVGVVWGAVPFYGILGIGIYLLLTTAIGHFYVTAYQRQDEERFGGIWELAKEGFGSSFATFLVCWILVYTAIHFDTLSST